MTEYEEKLLPLTDDELAQTINVILAAHSKQFPQLMGRPVSPADRDEARRHFAVTLVEHLRRGKIHFFRRDYD